MPFPANTTRLETDRMEREVSKEEFKALYFKYARPDSGWTEDYWNAFYEKEAGKTYFFTAPDTPKAARMFVVEDRRVRRMVFLTEKAEESFFDRPGAK